MTILHIVPDHELGGGAVMVARLLRALEATDDGPAGHAAVLPGNAEAPLRALFEGLPHRLGGYAGRASPPRMARGVAREAGAGDLIHAHGTRAALAAAMAAVPRRDLRVIYTVHGFHGLAQPGPLRLRARLEHLLARRVDATAFVSQADAALARAQGLRPRGPAVVIENGMAVAPAQPGAARGVDLLWVGRMVPQKWPEAFVETLAALPRPVRAEMAGAGERGAETDALAARLGVSGLVRHGGLAPEATLARMRRAKLLVMTSRWEGLPTVAIEAAMSGALVAGFDIPPLREALGDAVADRTLTPPEPEALAARLAHLLSDAAEREALAAELQAQARARFAPARMAARYAELYRQVLDA